MNWKPCPLAITGFAIISAPIVAEAKIYLSVEQAQKILMPNQKLSKMPMIISDDLQEKMRSASSIRHPFQGNQIWRANDGSWFIVDEVVGKHEMITYALGISPDGSVKQIEILEYRESYGHEVAQEKWRAQFVGKTGSSVLKLNKDIENISGATLSAKHLTDGVKRLLVMYDLALKN